MQPTTPSPNLNMSTPPTVQLKKPFRWRWPLLILLIAAVIAAGVAAYVYFSTDKTTTASSAQVEITRGSFNPATITIKKGQVVTWTNNDNRPHQIIADSSGSTGLSSEDSIQPSDSYTFTFENTGSFSYHETIDGKNITGTVIVQ